MYWNFPQDGLSLCFEDRKVDRSQGPVRLLDAVHVSDSCTLELPFGIKFDCSGKDVVDKVELWLLIVLYEMRMCQPDKSSSFDGLLFLAWRANNEEGRRANQYLYFIC